MVVKMSAPFSSSLLPSSFLSFLREREEERILGGVKERERGATGAQQMRYTFSFLFVLFSQVKASSYSLEKDESETKLYER